MTIPGTLVTTPLFDGDESYIAYPPLTNIHNDLRIEMEFKPMDSDGLMFFSGGKKMKVEDFVMLSMVDGHVEFLYELGTGERSDDQIMMYSLQKKKKYLFILIFLCMCVMVIERNQCYFSVVDIILQF